MLQAMSRRGNVVPALDNRPTLPEHLNSAFFCYTDIVREGMVPWLEFADWVERNEVPPEDREYLWEVIGKTNLVVQKWQSTKRQSSPKSPSTPSPPARKLLGPG